MFSIVIPVKNEESNLPSCLEKLNDFDDVIIVDSGSTDRTREISLLYGRPVVDFKWDGKFPKKRNWVLKNVSFKYPWVLFLDADERMTEAFKSEIVKTLGTTPHHGFWITYDNWFLGRMLKYGDPMRKLALLKIGHGAYEKIEEDHWSVLDMEIHEHLVVEGSIGAILARLEHHDKRPLESYYARHNDYSNWEARRYVALRQSDSNVHTMGSYSCLTPRQRMKYRMIRWKLFPIFYFIASYVFKGGFMDGVAGFYFATGKMFYFYQIQAKIAEND
jgi:glycosyltransferase involved in cell wall biosynthesis